MIEFISALSKAAGQFSLAWLIGGIIFFRLSGASRDPIIQSGKDFIARFYPAAALTVILTAALGLLAQTAITAQLSLSEIIQNSSLLWSFTFETRAGRLSALRLLSALFLLAGSIFYARGRKNNTENLSAALVLIPAFITAALGPMTGHTAGSENALWLTPLHILHALAISCWLGGLPAWIALVTVTGRNTDTGRSRHVAQALQRFSYLAMICMLIIIGTGVALSLEFVITQGDLLSTRYGLLICAKVLLLLGVLAIANHARLRLLPGITNAAGADHFYPMAARWISAELLLAALILGLGSLLSQTMPAVHDQPAWWLPFRFSIDATWPVPPTPLIVSLCGIILLFTAALLAVNYKKMSLSHRAALSGAGFLSAAVALWYLSVPAFPDTYKRSEVPYLTLSIAKGMAQFEPHCSSCHGTGGLGDGALAAGLAKPPADLSAPHTALHTSGDMFWWLTHGIPESGMPGFADSLSEQDRWDIINFLRAFSQGFEARILSPRISPRQPWLGAPNFYYETETSEPRALQDFREIANVLLVIPAPEDAQSQTRLDQLTQENQSLRDAGLEVLVISDPEVRQSFELLSRTLSNRGNHRAIGFPRKHMEFLIDRFGYIRARWLPEEDSEGWRDIAALREQSAALRNEPQILPPPSDHVH